MKKLTLNVLMCALPGVLFSQQTEQRIYKDAVSLGMGGVGVSTYSYSFSPSANPASLGLMYNHDIAPFFSLGLDVNPDAVETISSFAGAVSEGLDLTRIEVNDYLGKTSLTLNGPLNAGYFGKGFGVWTTSTSDLSIETKENPASYAAQIGIELDDIVSYGQEVYALYDSGQLNGTPEQIAQQILSTANPNLQEAAQDLNLSQAEYEALVDEVAADPEQFLREQIPLARIRNTFEITANIGYGYKIPFRFIDDVSGLSVGATVRFSQRFKQDTQSYITVDELVPYASDIAANTFHGSSISADFGTSLQLQNFVFAVAVRDAVSTGYQWRAFEGLGILPNSKIPYSVDFGASYRFYFNNRFAQELGLYVEFEDTTSTYTTWANKVRAGAEVKLFNFLDLRVGVYESSPTAGVGMGWKWGRIDFAYYRKNYFNIAKRDQFYLNFTLGLDNSPQRKAKSQKLQEESDRAVAQVNSLLEDTLQGI